MEEERRGTRETKGREGGREERASDPDIRSRRKMVEMHMAQSMGLRGDVSEWWKIGGEGLMVVAAEEERRYKIERDEID